MTTTDTTNLFRHMQWADAVTWNAILDSDSARADPVVMERLHHVHQVQRIYLDMWRGTPSRGRELTTFGSLAEVYEWTRDYYRDLATFAATLSDAALERTVAFPWADELAKWFGEARSATLGETVQQVAMHSAHHRGQLATMIRQHGGTPPLVDLIGWVWMGKPEPAWRSVAP